MENRISLNCYLIEPAENFILLLSKPITSYLKLNDNYNLYSKWCRCFLDLYNNNADFLLMADTQINERKTMELGILNKDFIYNYEITKINLSSLSENFKIWQELNINLTTKNQPDNIHELLESIEKYEEKHKLVIENTIFRFVVFVYQYLNYFEKQSINNNLWNYCLRSMTFSYKCFFIGIFTLLCQYIWTGTLLYKIIIDFKISNDPLIIIITIISTIISLFYSCNTFYSYLHSRKLYRFLIKLYNDYPELMLVDKDRCCINNNKTNFNTMDQHFSSYLFNKRKVFFKENKISMNKLIINYNWWADFLSNFVLPLIIPVINVFIILNSENILDAILNSIAVFFIIQIDEDLYQISSDEENKNIKFFTKWVISVIYTKHFPLFENIFKYECDNIVKRKTVYRFNNNKVDSVIINTL